MREKAIQLTCDHLGHTCYYVKTYDERTYSTPGEWIRTMQKVIDHNKAAGVISCFLHDAPYHDLYEFIDSIL